MRKLEEYSKFWLGEKKAQDTPEGLKIIEFGKDESNGEISVSKWNRDERVNK